MKITIQCISLILAVLSLFSCHNENQVPINKVIPPKKDSLFLAMLYEEVITDTNEYKYISDIHKLQYIQSISCDSTHIHYLDTIDNQRIDLTLKLKPFSHQNHTIQYTTGAYKDCITIDDNHPWGGYYGCPKTEVQSITVKINDKIINLNEQVSDVFDIATCAQGSYEYFTPTPSLVYDSNHQVFYLYIEGGNAADSYFSKFIFNENGFIKRYLLHYDQLSKTASFHRQFKGF